MTTHKLSYEAIMEMSSDEFAKLTPEQLRALEEADPTDDDNQDDDNGQQAVAPSQESEEQSDDDDDGEGQQEQQTEVTDQDELDKEDDNASPETDEGTQGIEEGSEADDTDQADGDDTEQDKKQKETEEKKEDLIAQEEAAKYKSFFDNVTAKFKANGTDFQITDPADIVSLMQKGLNYNQKMAGIKPYYALIEVLKENGLTDANNLSYLIDLKNKKPEAIAKLIQESGHDTYELDDTKANGYVPTPIDISSQRAEIVAIEQEYQNDPEFAEVLGTLSKWDDGSRTHIANNPTMIRMLMDHKKGGLFDQIMPAVQQQMALGRVQGTILEAYDQVGRAMFAAAPQQQQGEAQAQQPVVQQQRAPQRPTASPQQQAQQKLDAAKKAASMTNTVRKQAADTSKLNITEEDIYNMSPEDLAKINPKYLRQG